MLESILLDFGLTSYETKVYVALLELGESTTGEVLKEARIQTGKIYQILDSLSKKGFVSSIKRNGVQRFFPIPPDQISSAFDERRKQIDQQENDFNKILPDIMSKISSKKNPVHFELLVGFQGLKRAFDRECSKYTKDAALRICGVTDYGSHQKKIVDFFVYNVFAQRDEKKITVKKICDVGAKSNIAEKRSQMRFLPYQSLMTYNVIDDLVLVCIWTDEPLFLLIESQEVASSFAKNFDLLWKIAKEN